MLKQICSTATLCLLFFVGSTTTLHNNYTYTFIELQSEYAIREMDRTSIPASITIAQSIIESSWGNGTLAVEGNNFFGIKCKKNWQGPTVHVEDDDYVNGQLIASCFRAYSSVEDSYIDHSNFLMDNPRYARLFQLSPTDYVGWARGLQAAGYATDPEYANKLIAKIEEFQLYQYDINWNGNNTPSKDSYQYTSSQYNNETNLVEEKETVNIPDAFVLPDDYTPNYFERTKGWTNYPERAEPAPAIQVQARNASAPSKPRRLK